MNSVMKLCTAHFFICGPKISPRAFHLWCNAASRRDRGGDVASSDRQSVPHQPTHVSLLVLRALEGEHAFVRYRPGRFNARTHALTVRRPPLDTRRASNLRRATGRSFVLRPSFAVERSSEGVSRDVEPR